MALYGQLALGIALGLAALGSAVGIGAAGRAAAGAWAKEAKAGQRLRFNYIVLVGLPLSQTIYAFIYMVFVRDRIYDPAFLTNHLWTAFGLGLAVGLAELFSAWMQGLIGAAGCRCLSEGEGKGFPLLLMAMGIVETVGLFSMVFVLLVMPGG